MRLGNMYGPDATFAGVPAADLDDPASLAEAGAVIIGAPFDGGTSHRPGCRFGPLAIGTTDECDAVFLSVDVDVVDPGSAPATGTPEPGGLSARELLDAVRRIAMELPLAGMDIVELSPPFDHAEVTACLRNRIVLEALSGIAWRRARDSGRKVRQPSDPLLDR
ncbi:MAG: arginase family protein [Acidimicrobiales bacterium]|jgi:arginase family enzyme